MDPSLLTPSLSSEQPRAIYSKTALFASAFLGGSFALIMMAALNSHRLNRLRADAWWLLGAVVTAIVAIGVGVEIFSRDGAEASELGDYVKLANRGVAFALWFGFTYLHRQAHRAMETFGTTPRKPYLMVFVSFVVGVALLMLVSLIFLFPDAPK